MLIPASEIKIAEEPIIVSKDLGSIDSWFFGLFKYWHSPNYQIKERRRFGKAYKACEHLVIENNAIYQGFHAYRDTPGVHAYFFPNAVIPKGSEYCIDEENGIVANQIIVFDSYEKLEAYVSKNK